MVFFSETFWSELTVAGVGSIIGGGIAFLVALFTSKQESKKTRKQMAEEKKATLSLERTLYLEKMELDDLLKLENELKHSAEIFVAMHREIKKKLPGIPVSKNMVDAIGDLSNNLTNIDMYIKQYFPNEIGQEIFSEYLAKAKEFKDYLLEDGEDISEENVEKTHRELTDRNNKLFVSVSEERHKKFKEMRNKTIKSN